MGRLAQAAPDKLRNVSASFVAGVDADICSLRLCIRNLSNCLSCTHSNPLLQFSVASGPSGPWSPMTLNPVRGTGEYSRILAILSAFFKTTWHSAVPVPACVPACPSSSLRNQLYGRWLLQHANGDRCGTMHRSMDRARCTTHIDYPSGNNDPLRNWFLANMGSRYGARQGEGGRQARIEVKLAIHIGVEPVLTRPSGPAFPMTFFVAGLPNLKSR